MTTDELIRRLRENPAWGEQGDLMLEAARRLEEERDAAWDVFETITSAYGGKQIFFKQEDGMVYDRYKAEYITFEEAIIRFCRLVGDDGE